MERFRDTVRIKALLISFIAYIVASVLAIGILVQFWLPTGIPADEMARIADTSPFLLGAQIVIGTVLAVTAGFLACHLSGASGLRNSLIAGITLLGNSVLATVLHPELPIWQHLMHFIAPVPLALMGGLLRLRLVRPTMLTDSPAVQP